jgi:divalent metal cation (Fe/Co/Zn/Cd) transporter
VPSGSPRYEFYRGLPVEGRQQDYRGGPIPNQSMRTVLVSLVAGLGVAVAKAGAAVFTGSSAMAAEAAHSLGDTANDMFLFVAQRRSSHSPDDQHPLG